MAEIVYTLGGVVALLVGASATNHISDLLFSEPADRIYARDRFGFNKKFFVAAVFDVRQLRRIEHQTLQGSDDAVMTFKSSHLSSIGQTSVASAIIAQLGMTTLQLPGLDNVHWTAPGFVIASLLFGVLSVIITCAQQQILGTLNNPDRVRLWLSNGSYSDSGKGAQNSADEAEGDEGSTDTADGNKPRLQASLAALVLLSLPNTFLSYAVICFLTGMGVYLARAYKQDLQNTPGRNNNEAVMILFFIVAAVAITEAASVAIWKLWESSYAEKTMGGDMSKAKNNEQSSDRKSARARKNSDPDETSPLLSGENASSGRDAEIRKALQAMAKAHEDCASAERRLADLMKQR